MVSEPDPDVSLLPPAPSPSHKRCLRAVKSTAFKREERRKHKGRSGSSSGNARSRSGSTRSNARRRSGSAASTRRRSASASGSASGRTPSP